MKKLSIYEDRKGKIMVKVILIRHGETNWNTKQIFRGRKDIPLNEVGLAQAKAVGISLKDIQIDAVYSSPLGRALETANALSESRSLEIELDEGFIDIDFGKWQGTSHEEVQKKYKDLYEMWLTKPQMVTFPEGESLKDVNTRSMEALEKVIKKHPGKTLAIVSHRVLNKVLLCSVLGLELSHFWFIKQDTCAINRFEYKDERFYLTLLNDTCHLKRVEGASPVDF
ncbi:MAG: histidine phosphatase family protein [Thermodesulfobacteriota bacterium]|jgi:broad specificity phosphatase PhoE